LQFEPNFGGETSIVPAAPAPWGLFGAHPESFSPPANSLTFSPICGIFSAKAPYATKVAYPTETSKEDT
jgi:hypothetical protein